MNEWISVNERLPDDINVIVRVKYASGQGVGSVLRDGTGKTWIQPLKSSEIVTHWQPMPAQAEE